MGRPYAYDIPYAETLEQRKERIAAMEKSLTEQLAEVRRMREQLPEE